MLLLIWLLFCDDFAWYTKQALRIISNVDLLGRLVGVHSKKSQSTFSSSAYGKRKHWKTDIPGRIQLDMIDYIRRNHKVIIIEIYIPFYRMTEYFTNLMTYHPWFFFKLSSYSLNAVSYEFLKQQKEDVHHSIISELQMGSAEDRRRLAVYCLKDAFLPLRLMDNQYVLISLIIYMISYLSNLWSNVNKNSFAGRERENFAAVQGACAFALDISSSPTWLLWTYTNLYVLYMYSPTTNVIYYIGTFFLTMSKWLVSLVCRSTSSSHAASRSKLCPCSTARLSLSTSSSRRWGNAATLGRQTIMKAQPLLSRNVLFTTRRSQRFVRVRAYFILFFRSIIWLNTTLCLMIVRWIFYFRSPTNDIVFELVRYIVWLNTSLI